MTIPQLFTGCRLIKLTPLDALRKRGLDVLIKTYQEGETINKDFGAFLQNPIPLHVETDSPLWVF